MFFTTLPVLCGQLRDCTASCCSTKGYCFDSAIITDPSVTPIVDVFPLSLYYLIFQFDTAIPFLPCSCIAPDIQTGSKEAKMEELGLQRLGVR